MAMSRLQAIPIDKPSIFIIMYARCLLNELKLCLMRLRNIIIRFRDDLYFYLINSFQAIISNPDYISFYSYLSD